MDINRIFDEAIELIQNRRKLSIESHTSKSEYNYGRTTAFNEAIATLKDLKKSIVAPEICTKIENSNNNHIVYAKKEQKIIGDNTIQIV